MRRIALTLLAFSLVAVSPAAADLEDCIGALEAVETYREAIEPADAAFHQARREVDEVHAEATRRAHQAWAAAWNDRATELRELNPYGNTEERAQYEALRAEIEARYAPLINAAYRMWDEADTARDTAWDQARATYEQIEVPAKWQHCGKPTPAPRAITPRSWTACSESSCRSARGCYADGWLVRRISPQNCTPNNIQLATSVASPPRRSNDGCSRYASPGPSQPASLAAQGRTDCLARRQKPRAYSVPAASAVGATMSRYVPPTPALWLLPLCVAQAATEGLVAGCRTGAVGASRQATEIRGQADHMPAPRGCRSLRHSQFRLFLGDSSRPSFLGNE